MSAPVTREELIAAATVLHDEECRSCDRKYRMSCPNMAAAILRSGPAAVKAREALSDPQPPAVITATPTIQSGLVVRWRAVVNGGALLSASRARVMIHGDVELSRIEPWLDDARRVHEALKAGRSEEAEALATHEDRGLDVDLVPIKRSES